MGRLNSAEELGKKETYEAFKRAFLLPEDLLEAFYDQREVKWMFTSEEIESVRRSWTVRVSPGQE